jgi:branched-chain amino acid transport system ATP-binding protein
MALLEVDELRAGYGFPVLMGISFEVNEGETAVLFGLNGAGKTTTLSAIAGLLKPDGGAIRFDGRRVDGWSPTQLVRAGIALVPEGRRVFPGLTVANNLRLGAWTRRHRRDEVDERRDLVFEYFPRLAERSDQQAGTLSGGEQQMLAIGRALMANPKLLLLDEPSMGIAPVLVERIYETIVEINRQGTTILLVEQNANYALEVSSRAYVLETGSVALADESDRLRDNPEVQKAYLGA